MAEQSIGLRERTRRAVRAEIVAVATELFTRDGFEATTVDDIASAAAISRSSFFRYFATKEDVVLQLVVDTGEQVAAAVDARPPGESPWVCLRRAFDRLVGDMEDRPDRALEATRLIRRSPALHAAHLQRVSAWSVLMAERLEPRLTASGDADAFGDPGPGESGGARDAGLRATALAGAALACLEAASERWVADDGASPFGALLDEAMGAVAPLG